MGLDMYLRKERKLSGRLINGKNEGRLTTTESWDLAYWRKHNRLHGWMAEQWEDGTPEEFNCVDLELTSELLNQLLVVLKNNDLPETSGFFFGGDSQDDEQYQEDFDIFKDALKEIENGWTIIYSSWW